MLKKQSLNSIQKTDVNNQVTGTTVLIGTTAVILYTCPTGKRALVKSFKITPTGFGAGTFIDAYKSTTPIKRYTAMATAMDEIAGQGILLVAGQTLRLKGDSAANNESADYDISMQELPA